MTEFQCVWTVRAYLLQRQALHHGHCGLQQAPLTESSSVVCLPQIHLVQRTLVRTHGGMAKVHTVTYHRNALQGGRKQANRVLCWKGRGHQNIWQLLSALSDLTLVKSCETGLAHHHREVETPANHFQSPVVHSLWFWSSGHHVGLLSVFYDCLLSCWCSGKLVWNYSMSSDSQNSLVPNTKTLFQVAPVRALWKFCNNFQYMYFLPNLVCKAGIRKFLENQSHSVNKLLSHWWYLVKIEVTVEQNTS